MSEALLKHLDDQLAGIEAEGLTKRERAITSPQSATIHVAGRDDNVLNLCANNYLGLADHPELIAAAKQALDEHGFGMASVRFICGTQDLHLALEEALSAFLQTEATILFSSCFDANTALFEAILGEEDAVISDALNHASIIDGIRLCKAKRYRYANNDMADLERCLKDAQDQRFRLIVTDGVFSMDGIIAKLPEICALAEKYDALVMVDDSHAVGFVGDKGRGTPEAMGVAERVDILTGTLGKALGGASGGYVSGRRQVVDILRQKGRPYLFSNALMPAICAASLKVLEMLEESDDLRRRLRDNAEFFRRAMEEEGFTLAGGGHPIIPVMLGEAKLAEAMAARLMDDGIYVTAFSYPVVPKGQARIRTQMSAAHDRDQLAAAVAAFARVGRDLGVIG